MITYLTIKAYISNDWHHSSERDNNIRLKLVKSPDIPQPSPILELLYSLSIQYGKNIPTSRTFHLKNIPLDTI